MGRDDRKKKNIARGGECKRKKRKEEKRQVRNDKRIGKFKK